MNIVCRQIVIDYVELLIRLQRNDMRHIDAPFLFQDYRLRRRLERLISQAIRHVNNHIGQAPIRARHDFLRDSGSRMCLRTVWIE
jgi:hypothetical protein